MVGKDPRGVVERVSLLIILSCLLSDELILLSAVWFVCKRVLCCVCSTNCVFKKVFQR